MNHATMINDNAQQSVAGQKRTASVEQASGIFSSLIGETSVTQRWVVCSYSFTLPTISIYYIHPLKHFHYPRLAWGNLQFSVFNASEYIGWT